jgi:hypothetical protein
LGRSEGIFRSIGVDHSGEFCCSGGVNRSVGVNRCGEFCPSVGVEGCGKFWRSVEFFPSVEFGEPVTLPGTGLACLN